jgi:NCAIR mutase (PurE)-related protein
VREIFRVMIKKESNVIGTRASKEMYEAVKSISPDAVFYEVAKIISVQNRKPETQTGRIAVITAGTSDIPVAEEAAITAELLGNEVLRIYDAGVAGIHRLVDQLPAIRSCKVIIVIAGMEGALASVVGGLVDKPVIAVPTSVGYGASFGGISALLAMLTSCSSGVTVVNIDNGFGAGFSASMINRM